ncbi:MAG: hypothetical protein ACKO23_07270 [Gemmataceae bacterium]
MRLWGKGCLVILTLGLTVSITAAQPPDRKAAKEEETGWWNGLVGGNKAKEPAKKSAPPMTMADRAMEQDRLMRAYLRRQEVCDRLRDIAHQTENNSLLEEANRLEEMAWKIYQGRSSRLLGIPATSMADPEPIAEGESEEDTMDLLKKAAKSGGNMPARIRSGGKIEPERGGKSSAREGDQP